MKQVAGTDASLEPEPDFAKIDEAKLKAFQEQHQLSEYGPFDISLAPSSAIDHKTISERSIIIHCLQFNK